MKSFNKKIADCIFENRLSDEVAVVCKDISVTYKELWKQSVIFANKLKKYNSEYIAVHLANSIEYIVAYFSILICGKKVVPIGKALGEDEVYGILKKIGSDVLVTNDEISFENIKCEKCVLENDLDDELLDEEYSCSSDDIALVFPTSGTVSASKYVPQTNENVMTNVKGLLNIHNLSREKNNGERELIVLPFTSAFCNVTLLVCLYCKMPVYIYDGMINVIRMLNDMIKYQIRYCEMTPTLLKVFSGLYIRKKEDLKSLERITYGGEGITVEEMKSIQDNMADVELYFGYGLTEAGPVVAVNNHFTYKNVTGSVGRLLDGFEARLVDSEGNEVEKGQQGELQLKGPCVMKGYMNENDTGIEDGWLSTGDICYFDEDGRLYIKGRIKNIIITGGRNVFPEELESVLNCIDGVKDSKVYGRENSTLGEMIVADVVLENENAISVDNIKKECAKKVANYKIPKIFNVVDKIQRNKSGKIIRY